MLRYLWCFFLLASCTGVPFDAPRTESQFLSANTHAPSDAAWPDRTRSNETLAVPLLGGRDGLAARLRLIEQARHSLDLQYFLVKPDAAGTLVSLALENAADRGVRVRVLLDDVFTTATLDEIALLDENPNIEVRLYNPLSKNAPKAVSYMFDFGRVNRRMHNKSMTMDGSFAIIGGRNIADEYYSIGQKHEFADYDLLVEGEAVDEIGAAFDLFWNDPRSVPVSALLDEKAPGELRGIRRSLDERAELYIRDLHAETMDIPFMRDFLAGRVEVHRGTADFVTDSPEKLKVPVRGGERRLAEALLQRMQRAEKQVVLLTPYFVPEDWGARFFSDLAARGVEVIIVTNSLAATNHPYVHAGYMRHRRALLSAGVRLHEVRSQVPEEVVAGPDGGPLPDLTMHTKLALIDGSELFVGSLNFDPRSIKINSEVGLFMDSPTIAADTRKMVSEGLPLFTYALSLDEDNDLVWTYTGAATPERETSEPGASAWRKFVAGFTAILPVESQL